MSSEGTSTSSDSDRMAATESAVNILAQGKRNMVCGEIPTAVNQFQEACSILSKAYGETAKECADAYFCYGQALLDLARMENGVLGNALQGVPDTDDETTEQKDEEERDKLRKEVYDAMGEKETEKKERENKEKEQKKESGETMEVSMDTEDKEKKEDKEEKKEQDEVKEKEIKEKVEEGKKEDEEKVKKDVKESEKDQKDEKTEKDAEKKEDGEVKKDIKETEKDKTEEKESEENSAEEGEDGEGTEEEEGEGTEEEEGEGMEEEGEGMKEEGAEPAEDAGETTSQNGSQDGENPEDVSNLQLAWEMLELAKLIYAKDESKEAKLRSAESHLKLGEVSLETEQYEEAIKDLNKCLDIQKEILDSDNRLIAETYYQLGLAYCFNKNFKESTESYQHAIKVMEDRIANLTKVVDAAKPEEKETSDFDHPVYKAKKEIGELEEILPDIKAKIEDVEDEKKNMEDLKNLAKEALGGLTSSSGSSSSSAPIDTPAEPSKEEKAASDISHLIKRKRKSEEGDEEATKKAKSEEGAGDAPKVNGHDKKAEEPMETKS
ncbi:histone-binding protein N1/N2-like isoform X2 [Mya arenaria]|uniref:histone-binding protein N1/N2-like isoform X2 n=1 Tax=Mya arenaria TaxID=6604 RepID=UPI0022DF72B2|nr:histone-binding protein N1/N2-like isoform X2 [Mya arenaria]